MHDQYQLPPPSSWEKFESLCRDLYAAELGDPNTQKNGRSGYPQCGVDVYGYTKDGRLLGVQCKKKDIAMSSLVREQELREEVKKAVGFNPKLSYFVFASTLPSNPKTSEIARNITKEHSTLGLFSVSYLGWNDILDKLVAHPELISRYYSWTLPGGRSNEYAFDSWKERFNCKYIFYNACLIPFCSSGQVHFRPGFLADLSSFSSQSKILFDESRTRNMDNSLRKALANFDAVASDLIEHACIDSSRPDSDSDIYMYWVDKGDLPYHRQREYVEYKKRVLLGLFYNLILAANHIIDEKNKLSDSEAPIHDYVRFCGNFYISSEMTIPVYPKDAARLGMLYSGISSLKDWCAQGMTDPVIAFEQAIKAGKSTKTLL